MVGRNILANARQQAASGHGERFEQSWHRGGKVERRREGDGARSIDKVARILIESTETRKLFVLLLDFPARRLRRSQVPVNMAVTANEVNDVLPTEQGGIQGANVLIIDNYDRQVLQSGRWLLRR